MTTRKSKIGGIYAYLAHSVDGGLAFFFFFFGGGVYTPFPPKGALGYESLTFEGLGLPTGQQADDGLARTIGMCICAYMYTHRCTSSLKE